MDNKNLCVINKVSTKNWSNIDSIAIDKETTEDNIIITMYILDEEKYYPYDKFNNLDSVRKFIIDKNIIKDKEEMFISEYIYIPKIFIKKSKCY